MKTPTKRINYLNKQSAAQKNKARPAPEYAGVHLLAEFWNGKEIEDPSMLDTILRTAAAKSNNKALKVEIHKFLPCGITGFVMLAESHMSIHSWPEINYLAIDIFTCGDHAMPHKALEYLREVYGPQRVEIQEIKRGKL
jgi:S-adenosylmethionine decarboxylase